MQEESLSKNQGGGGITGAEVCRRSHGGGIKRRTHGGGILEEESWRGIMDYASWREFRGGPPAIARGTQEAQGSTQEAQGSTQVAPRRTQEAPRMYREALRRQQRTHRSASLREVFLRSEAPAHSRVTFERSEVTTTA